MKFWYVSLRLWTFHENQITVDQNLFHSGRSGWGRILFSKSKELFSRHIYPERLVCIVLSWWNSRNINVPMLNSSYTPPILKVGLRSAPNLLQTKSRVIKWKSIPYCAKENKNEFLTGPHILRIKNHFFWWGLFGTHLRVHEYLETHELCKLDKAFIYNKDSIDNNMQGILFQNPS